MKQSDFNEPPPGQYTLIERNAILQRELDLFTKKGYTVLWQTDDDATAQVYRPKFFGDNLIDIITSLLFEKKCLYLVEVNEYGKVIFTDMS